MATHSSILAWRILWTEEPGGCSPLGHKESDTTERLTHTQQMMTELSALKEPFYSSVIVGQGGKQGPVEVAGPRSPRCLLGAKSS